MERRSATSSSRSSSRETPFYLLVERGSVAELATSRSKLRVARLGITGTDTRLPAGGQKAAQKQDTAEFSSRPIVHASTTRKPRESRWKGAPTRTKIMVLAHGKLPRRDSYVSSSVNASKKIPRKSLR